MSLKFHTEKLLKKVKAKKKSLKGRQAIAANPKKRKMVDVDAAALANERKNSVRSSTTSFVYHGSFGDPQDRIHVGTAKANKLLGLPHILHLIDVCGASGYQAKKKKGKTLQPVKLQFRVAPVLDEAFINCTLPFKSNLSSLRIADITNTGTTNTIKLGELMSSGELTPELYSAGLSLEELTEAGDHKARLRSRLTGSRVTVGQLTTLKTDFNYKADVQKKMKNTNCSEASTKLKKKGGEKNSNYVSQRCNLPEPYACMNGYRTDSKESATCDFSPKLFETVSKDETYKMICQIQHDFVVEIYGQDYVNMFMNMIPQEHRLYKDMIWTQCGIVGGSQTKKKIDCEFGTQMDTNETESSTSTTEKNEASGLGFCEGHIDLFSIVNCLMICCNHDTIGGSTRFWSNSNNLDGTTNYFDVLLGNYRLILAPFNRLRHAATAYKNGRICIGCYVDERLLRFYHSYSYIDRSHELNYTYSSDYHTCFIPRTETKYNSLTKTFETMYHEKSFGVGRSDRSEENDTRKMLKM